LDLRSVNPSIVYKLRPIVGGPNACNIQLLPHGSASDHFIFTAGPAPDAKTIVRLIHSDDRGNSAFGLWDLSTGLAGLVWIDGLTLLSGRVVLVSLALTWLTALRQTHIGYIHSDCQCN